jgi:NAD(P)-dependent dehydrogenase (short-subunit alcohol dehydrogenase family)
VSIPAILDEMLIDLRSTFGANTLAQFWILKAFLPEMIKRGSGHVVTMSSVLGLVNTAQMSESCALSRQFSDRRDQPTTAQARQPWSASTKASAPS